ncbi:MAG: hypothetical protein ACFE9S_12710 [Candidatus Hermodarchaeota archaeon]
MPDKEEEQAVGRPEPEFKIDFITIIWIIVGLIVSWVNMIIISESMEIWSYLTIIFTTIIPTLIIGLKNRFWGYGYLFGFAIAGIPFVFIVDPFIGGYTFFTSLFIFIILWLIFWKAWRSLSSIKQTT